MVRRNGASTTLGYGFPSAPVMRWQLGTVLFVGLVAACVERFPSEDGEERRERCSSISFEGIDAEGNVFHLWTDPELGRTPQLCTCSTDAQSLDFSVGGYRDYINELGFEECKRISEGKADVENTCLEQYERREFGLIYGRGPIPANPPVVEPGHEWPTPLCGEVHDDQAGCS